MDFLALENVSQVQRLWAIADRKVVLWEQKRSVILAFSQQRDLGPDPALCPAGTGGAEDQAFE